LIWAWIMHSYFEKRSFRGKDKATLKKTTPFSLVAVGGTLLALVSLFNNRKLDSSSFWQGDGGFVSFSENETVSFSRGKVQSSNVFNVRNVMGTRVSLDLSNVSNSTSVSSLRDHDSGADVEFVEIGNFSRLQVQLDGVTDLDIRIGESNRSSVVGGNVRDSSAASLGLLDLAELELRFGGSNGGKNEASLDIVQQSEVFVNSGNADHVLESSGVFGVQLALSVNLDELVHQNHFDFRTGEGVFQSISENYDQRKALSELVGTSRRTRGPNSAELVKHPVLGGC